MGASLFLRREFSEGGSERNDCRTRCPIFSGCLPPPRTLRRRPRHQGQVRHLYVVRRRPFPRPVVSSREPTGERSTFSSTTHVERAVPWVCVRRRCVRHGGLRTNHRLARYLHMALPVHQPPEKIRKSTIDRVVQIVKLHAGIMHCIFNEYHLDLYSCLETKAVIFHTQFSSACFLETIARI
jgi:hypothetical protein